LTGLCAEGTVCRGLRHVIWAQSNGACDGACRATVPAKMPRFLHTPVKCIQGNGPMKPLAIGTGPEGVVEGANGGAAAPEAAAGSAMSSPRSRKPQFRPSPVEPVEQRWRPTGMFSRALSADRCSCHSIPHLLQLPLHPTLAAAHRSSGTAAHRSSGTAAHRTLSMRALAMFSSRDNAARLLSCMLIAVAGHRTSGDLAAGQCRSCVPACPSISLCIRHDTAHLLATKPLHRQ
jgi:hypothetical protein